MDGGNAGRKGGFKIKGVSDVWREGVIVTGTLSEGHVNVVLVSRHFK